jgi:hypothetical protein
MYKVWDVVLVCNQDKFDLRKELRILVWEVVLVCNQDKLDFRKELRILVWVFRNQDKFYLS